MDYIHSVIKILQNLYKQVLWAPVTEVFMIILMLFLLDLPSNKENINEL